MNNKLEILNVDLGDRSYPIYIGEGLLTQPAFVEKHIVSNQVLIVTNETIAPMYLSQLVDQLPVGVDVRTAILPDGERFKTLEYLNKIFDSLLENRCNRQVTLIALGGGVIGDMTGFAAASYQRGVSFIQLPTTLLSQVDSSVGGKTGVNHRLGKNMIGAFYQPKAVLIDTTVLSTLPAKELSAGLAEVIKYGAINDVDFFVWLEKNIEYLLAQKADALIYAIKRSCEKKAEIVEKDEKESGIRATLNFGHTFGHAIETHMGYGEWLHGEAVAAGMCLAAELSVELGWMSSDEAARIKALCIKASLPVKAPEEMDGADFIKHMKVDKKNTSGSIRLVLLKNLGEAVIYDCTDESLIKKVIDGKDRDVS
ncbi:3-dehydroquinate synthase [Cycloclasticus sp. P1]|uniref:3-dehydroquinate synthase n=1 Tax=Cycloclasticus sp. (strain P1) TaxID=385025 RepID=UPI000286A8A4|nr:3-dehydroquinate synthase [Cycloclasticus sp. P1]AFT66099.1 Dehydroquinate synthase [Cycloclasticus sp. P1]